MEILKQSSEYNCGVFALHFLLQCSGVEQNLAALEKELGTTEEKGTSHKAMVRILKHFKIKTSYNSSLQKLSRHLPAIVNYQYTEIGHYGVVLSMTDNFLVLYNPDIGALETMRKSAFKKVWYSKLYGKKWFLTIKSLND